MKKLSFILILAVIFFTACKTDVQPKEETDINSETVDLKAIEETVEQTAEKYLEASNTKNIEVLNEMLSDNGLYCGSDPSELLNKKDLMDLWAEMFADTVTDYSYSVDIRKIKVAEDGKSAIVVEQINAGSWSSNLSIRQIIHMENIEDTWKIDFVSWGFIAKNEDVEKLNNALAPEM